MAHGRLWTLYEGPRWTSKQTSVILEHFPQNNRLIFRPLWQIVTTISTDLLVLYPVCTCETKTLD